MKKNCDNCVHHNAEIIAPECDFCVINDNSDNKEPSNWTPIEPEQKPQTSYAVIPMDEYLFLFTQIKDLQVENAGLKTELETTKRFLSEATSTIDKTFGGE